MPRSSSASSRAATAGCSRRAGHANYGVGGWASEGPRLREHLHGSARTTGSTRTGSPACRDATADPADDRGATGAGPARRRRRRARRSALRRRDLRGIRLRALSGRGDPGRRTRRVLPALEHALDRYARSSWKAKLVLDRHPRACLSRSRAPPGLGCDRGPADRRAPTPERRPRARPSSAPPACPSLKANGDPKPIPCARPSMDLEHPAPACRGTRRQRHPPQGRPAANASARRHARAARRLPRAERPALARDPRGRDQADARALEVVRRERRPRHRLHRRRAAALPRQRLQAARSDLVRVPHHPARGAELRGAAVCPHGVRRLANEQRGLILVTGATGSGKTTTLAAMIDHINSDAAAAHRHDRGSDRDAASRQAAASSTSARSGSTPRASRRRCAACCARTRT